MAGSISQSMAPGELRRRAARGTIVNGAFLVAVNLLTLSRGLVVAAFLTLEDYGVWGVLAFGLLTLAQLKQVGITERYVQQEERDQEAAFHKAFTLDLVLSVTFGLVIAAAVPLVATAIDQPQIVAPGLVVALMLPGLGLQSALWVHYRRMDFARQRLLQSADPIVGFVVAVALAVAGAGYWALVLGAVAGAWAGALVSILGCPYRLRLRFERGAAREYLSFSWPLFAGVVSVVLIAQLTVFFGEALLGLAGLGALTLAAAILQYVNRVDQVVSQTLYPALCVVKGRTDVLFESFVKSNRLSLMWALPLGAALVLFSPDLVAFVLGEEWRPAVFVLQVCGGVAAVHQIGFNWGSYYTARGVTRPVATSAAFAIVTFAAVVPPLMAIGGLRGAALGMIVTEVVALAVRGHYLRRLFAGFSFAGHAVRALAPVAPPVVVVLLLRLLGDGTRTGWVAIGELAVFALCTVVALAFAERALIREVLGYLRRAPAPAPVPVQGAQA